jgi:hypothetical protein
MNAASELHGARDGREYLWFAATLLAVLATVAAHSPVRETASVQPDAVSQ